MENGYSRCGSVEGRCDSGNGWGTGIHPEIQEGAENRYPHADTGEGWGTGINHEVQDKGGERVSIMKFRIGVGNGYQS